MNKNMTPMKYILLGLIPYTDANIKLSFKPNLFFDELERLSKYKKYTLLRTYKAMRSEGLIYVDNGKVGLSLKARQKAEPYVASRLKEGKLLVIFDIPEYKSHLRHRLRGLLKYLEFEKIQQSVWVSDMDYRNIIRDTIIDLNIGEFVKVFEAVDMDIIQKRHGRDENAQSG